jgi:hypothetical protein
MSEPLDLRSKHRLKINQKGTDDVNFDVSDSLSVGVAKDVVELKYVGKSDGAVSMGCVTSNADLLSSAIVVVPELGAGHARLWDVISSMLASRLPRPPVST